MPEMVSIRPRECNESERLGSGVRTPTAVHDLTLAVASRGLRAR